MEKYYLPFFIFALCLFQSISYAEERSLISVSAEGSVKTKADMALININIQASELSAEKARERTDQQVKALLKQLKEFSIKDGSLDSSQTTIHAEYDYNIKPRQLLAYRANRTVSFALIELAQLEKLIQAISKIQQASLNQIQLTVQDNRSWEDLALKEALQLAKSKAELIANEMSVQLTGIHRVSHQASRATPPVFARAMMMEKDMGASNTYEQKELEVNAFVDVSFNFK